ncbi:MAG TPA: prepilin peptidase, partial [Pseudobdellovibrionaceae bacterium]|nr:prepilin peptidase [Pseudobdellovibrionaceae bacterium]
MWFDILMVIYFFIVGACFGSFANVIIYRLPKNLSVIRPGSHCYSCGASVRWYDNIPLISWWVLRGRCRQCQAPFSIRYWFVELITAVIFAGLYSYYGFSWILLEYLIFSFGLVVCTFIDFDHMILPDQFTLSGILLGLFGAFLNPDRSFLDSLWGVLFGGGFLWAIAYIYYAFTKREGMGGGDIKLLAWIGALLGWKAVPFVILLSSVIGTFVGLGLSV